MKNQTLWQGIASDLENEIVAGSLARGSRLPTESMLSQRYGVNRHTIRKALSHLAEKSLIWSKRGSGVFVMQKPTIYSMGERVRFSQNLLDAGRTPSRQKLSLSQRLATHEEASSLKIKKNSNVHHYEGISFADDEPIALFHSVFCSKRFPTLDKYIEDLQSVTQALRKCGVNDYIRASTYVSAVAASSLQANHLRIKPNDPLLCTTSLNTDQSGTPIEFGRTYFSGKHVTLSYKA